MKQSYANWFLPAFLALAPFLHPFSHAHASSPAAWDEFRQKVETSCRDAAEGRMDVGAIRIDPFGTQSYGVAILTEAGSGGGERVCVVDKQTGAAELSEPVEATEPQASDLAQSDRRQIEAISGQVTATLQDLRGKGLEVNEQAQSVAALLDGGPQAIDASQVKAGPYACTVWWYGFLEEGSDRVGTHKCAVETSGDGALRIRKFTGERINATTSALDGRTIYAGRKFLSGHRQTEYDIDQPVNTENENFGNKVGIVLRDGERLFLVSIEERGMSPPDDTFFEIIELVPET